MLRFAPRLLDKWVAPGVAEFRSAEIPDLSSTFPEAKHWLANHFLNNVTSELGGPQFRPDYRQVVIGYVRRVFHSFRAYHKARKLTYRHLRAGGSQQANVRRFYDVLAAWENFASEAQMACDLFKWINTGAGAFEKNDGTKMQRLYTIANHVKHTASCVSSGQSSASDTVPLWLTNDGINSFGVLVTFQEAAEILTEMSVLANELQAWPRSLRRTAESAAEG